MIQLPFEDRNEAGQLLATALKPYQIPANTIVLALPRGGVPVGCAVARAFGLPLDVVVVRKLGVPWQPELAMGAIACGSIVLDPRLIQELRISPKMIDSIVAKERAEVERREKLYRAGCPGLDLRNRTVVLVDDGLATGSTMMVAARYVRNSNPGRLIIAVPVGTVQACRRVENECDKCVCLATPEPFNAVGEWYMNFRQLSDPEVQRLLDESRRQVTLSEEHGLAHKSG